MTSSTRPKTFLAKEESGIKAESKGPEIVVRRPNSVLVYRDTVTLSVRKSPKKSAAVACSSSLAGRKRTAADRE